MNSYGTVESALLDSYNPKRRLPNGEFKAPEIIDDYRTEDGRAYFKFRFVPMGDYWEIDVLEHPNYKRFSFFRSAGLHQTHRLPSKRGGFRICFANPKDCKTLEDCYNFGAGWSELTWQYIQYGVRF